MANPNKKSSDIDQKENDHYRINNINIYGYYCTKIYWPNWKALWQLKCDAN